VFTSGGTEGDNLAVKGIYWARRSQDARRRRILATTIEHHAVMESVQWLADAQGAEVEWMPVDRQGRLDTAALRETIDREPESVALITVQWANGEVGTLQPIGEVVGAARQHGIPVHSDAVQAVGQVPVDFAASGLAAMTVSAHKLGGPGGAGAILLGRDLEPTPNLHGGGQERDVRSGSLDVPAIAGFAVAVDHVDVAAYTTRVRGLRDELVATVLEVAPDAVRNGALDPATGLPNLANFSFAGCEGDSLLLLLDAAGIAASTGSACSTGVTEPSHVLLAMGVDEALARGSLRFTLGRTTTRDDVVALNEALGPVVKRARAAGLVNTTSGKVT
jgi:cysteine desulfurase